MDSKMCVGAAVMNYTLYLSTLSIPNPSSAIVLGSVLQYQLQNLSEGTYH
jgi:hypothetical protein